MKLYLLLCIFLIAPLFSEEAYITPSETDLYQRHFVKVNFVSPYAPPGKTPISHVELDDHTTWYVELSNPEKFYSTSLEHDLQPGQEIYFEASPKTAEYFLRTNKTTWKSVIDKETKAFLPVILEITKFVSHKSWCSFFDEYSYSIHLSDGSYWMISDFTSKEAQVCIESWKKGDVILITRTINSPNWNLLNMNACYSQLVNGSLMDKRTLDTNCCHINLVRE